MKWIVRLIGIIVVIAAIGVGALFFLPAERVAQIAADQLRNATGRDVQIKGDVGLTFWPVLGARVDGLEVGNADWSAQGPMLSADRAAIGVDAMSLLRGDIRITNIEASSPTIRLEQRADGRASWQFTDASGAAQIETATTPERAPRPISIERLNVTNATLIYDAEGSDLVSYEGVDLTLDWPDRLGAATVSAVLRPTSDAVNVTAEIGGFAGFITGQVQPIDLQIRNASGSVALVGRASTDGSVAGDLRVQTNSTAGFLQALGLPRAELPKGLGQQITLATALTLTADRQLALRAIDADLGGNRLTGAADISLNGIPQVNAQLNAGALDLSGNETETAASGGSGAPGWSADPIDASGLAAFNGEIALRADSIDLGSVRLGPTRTLLRNENARMVFELREVSAYDGAVTGEFVINNRSGLSVGGNLAARGIQLQPLLQDTMNVSRLTGQSDADLSFLGSGGSVDAIMRSLSGSGAMKMGRGTIEGINLDRLMRSGSVNGGTTVFDSLGATFNIQAGVLSNQDLLLLLPNYRAEGAGAVNLGAQTLDYVFTPVATRANSGEGIAIPVRISGPWANPSIRPDLQAAIDLNLAAEKEELKQKARDKVTQELGLSVQDGQSTEDALKDKAEDAIKKKLFKLFD